ncbi:unnamed protein product [Arctia plantaginis]|uniref:G-patch domain-containing protein n=1 Tax=Arctia plantaginis TaxID=874455 RepID=A0A8S1A8X1_ARCPL|nr:unnamed protein product [Arctia plantaginis]
MFFSESTSPSPTTECVPIHWQNSVTESKEGSSTLNKGKMLRTNKIQKKFDKMLTKPVKMSKAESMMQKMGWHGGALGRSGSGILEPLASNAVYATQTKVCGKNFVKVENEDRFSMNVLYQIYEFVKNNAEVELVFDRTLSKEERKRIHNIVDFMLNVDGMSMVEFESTAQMDMVLQICDVNCYILQTQSEGGDPDRHICIYKEAPEHVYLIIPDDLREERPAVNPPAEQSDSKDEISDAELEEETNPFLRSITRNLKKTKEVVKVQKVQPVELPKEASVLEKIQEYFAEFAEKRQYSQFKFLGPFTDEETDGIHEFFEKAAQYVKNEPCEVKEVFAKISFEIGEDITGNTVINKRPK